MTKDNPYIQEHALLLVYSDQENYQCYLKRKKSLRGPWWAFLIAFLKQVGDKVN